MFNSFVLFQSPIRGCLIFTLVTLEWFSNWNGLDNLCGHFLVNFCNKFPHGFFTATCVVTLGTLEKFQYFSWFFSRQLSAYCCETFSASSGVSKTSFSDGLEIYSGGLVRLLASRSQHVSWAVLGSSEVTKGTIVPLDPSAFSAIEHLPLPLSARMQTNKTFHCLSN